MIGITQKAFNVMLMNHGYEQKVKGKINIISFDNPFSNSLISYNKKDIKSICYCAQYITVNLKNNSFDISLIDKKGFSINF